MASAIHCLVHLPGEPPRVLKPDELGKIDELRAVDGAVVWLDLRSPDAAALRLLREEFGVHPLAEEDLQKRSQRPKLDTYPDQQVAVVYEAIPPHEAASTAPTDLRAPRGGDDGGVPSDLGEIHAFIGKTWLVTVHWDESPALTESAKRFADRPDTAGKTAGALLYTILDSVVDGYFPVLDRLSERIDGLEDRIIAGHQDRETLRVVLRIKRELLELRRILAPMRDVANAFLRRDNASIDDPSLPYYADLYDHLVRILDQLDLLRDLVAAALDANLSVTSNNLNAVMKRLTAVTVILILPTIVSGIYGMNFRHMPELDWPLGYPLAIGIMAVVMGAAYFYFKAHDWF
jgi:magnesium transporter